MMLHLSSTYIGVKLQTYLCNFILKGYSGEELSISFLALGKISPTSYLPTKYNATARRWLSIKTRSRENSY